MGRRKKREKVRLAGQDDPIVEAAEVVDAMDLEPCEVMALSAVLRMSVVSKIPPASGATGTRWAGALHMDAKASGLIHVRMVELARGDNQFVTIENDEGVKEKALKSLVDLPYPPAQNREP